MIILYLVNLSTHFSTNTHSHSLIQIPVLSRGREQLLGINGKIVRWEGACVWNTLQVHDFRFFFWDFTGVIWPQGLPTYVFLYETTHSHTRVCPSVKTDTQSLCISLKHTHAQTFYQINSDITTLGPALILYILNTFHCLTQSCFVCLSISHSQAQYKRCSIIALGSLGNSLKPSLPP